MFIGMHGVLKERWDNNVMFVRALWFPFGPEAYCNNNNTTTIDNVCTTTTMALWLVILCISVSVYVYVHRSHVHMCVYIPVICMCVYVDELLNIARKRDTTIPLRGGSDRSSPDALQKKKSYTKRQNGLKRVCIFIPVTYYYYCYYCSRPKFQKRINALFIIYYYTYICVHNKRTCRCSGGSRLKAHIDVRRAVELSVVNRNSKPTSAYKIQYIVYLFIINS